MQLAIVQPCWTDQSQLIVWVAAAVEIEQVRDGRTFELHFFDKTWECVSNGSHDEDMIEPSFVKLAKDLQGDGWVYRRSAFITLENAHSIWKYHRAAVLDWCGVYCHAMQIENGEKRGQWMLLPCVLGGDDDEVRTSIHSAFQALVSLPDERIVFLAERLKDADRFLVAPGLQYQWDKVMDEISQPVLIASSDDAHSGRVPAEERAGHNVGHHVTLQKMHRPGGPVSTNHQVREKLEYRLGRGVDAYIQAEQTRFEKLAMISNALRRIDSKTVSFSEISVHSGLNQQAGERDEVSNINQDQQQSIGAHPPSVNDIPRETETSLADVHVSCHLLISQQSMLKQNTWKLMVTCDKCPANEANRDSCVLFDRHLVLCVPDACLHVKTQTQTMARSANRVQVLMMATVPLNQVQGSVVGVAIAGSKSEHVHSLGIVRVRPLIDTVARQPCHVNSHQLTWSGTESFLISEIVVQSRNGNAFADSNLCQWKERVWPQIIDQAPDDMMLTCTAHSHVAHISIRGRSLFMGTETVAEGQCPSMMAQANMLLLFIIQALPHGTKPVVLGRLTAWLTEAASLELALQKWNQSIFSSNAMIREERDHLQSESMLEEMACMDAQVAQLYERFRYVDFSDL